MEPPLDSPMQIRVRPLNTARTSALLGSVHVGGNYVPASSDDLPVQVAIAGTDLEVQAAAHRAVYAQDGAEDDIVKS